MRFPGISAELVRTLEITGNLNRCNIYFEKVCKRAVWYGGNAHLPTRLMDAIARIGSF
jgi:hypothetical protein